MIRRYQLGEETRGLIGRQLPNGIAKVMLGGQLGPRSGLTATTVSSPRICRLDYDLAGDSDATFTRAPSFPPDPHGLLSQLS